MTSYLDFAIYFTLLDGKCHSTFSLAKKFEVCKKTIYRHVANLSYAKVPITTLSGKNGGIMLTNTKQININFFSLPEINYLKELLLKHSDESLMSQNIISKIENILATQF